jgi:endonuclease G
MQPLKNTEEALKSRVAQLESFDPELARELKGVREKKRGKKAVEEMASFLESRAEPGEQPPQPPPQPMALETIVLRTGRPVLAVVDDGIQLQFNDVESEVWRSRLEAVSAMLRDAVRAVGRVEVTGHPHFEWIGTAWLVAPDVVVTNRHVAGEFGRSRGNGFSFRIGATGQRMGSSIDFREEIGRSATAEFNVLDILHIEGDDGPDVALLKVARKSGELALASPLVLRAAAVEPKQQVAVIGYPARDSRIPEPDLMRRIFGDVYDKKRLAPGTITGKNGGTVTHDCSTLGGNSGSVVLDLKTGQAVALHFAGRFLEANFAVAAPLIAERLHALEGRPGTKGTAVVTTSRKPAGATNQAVAAAAPAVSGRTATWTLPLQVTVTLGDQAITTTRAAVTTTTASSVVADDEEEEGWDDLEARPEDYADREGYQAGFLGDDAEVPLPEITGAAADVLEFDEDGDSASILKYEHFSVVMSRSRRMCVYSAVNIDGKQTKKVKRPGWRFDPRIPQTAQIKNECYGNEPKFARGHMTRREDPIWGSQSDASKGNSDSMHVTNATPQMQPFNAGIWLGLEDYALENAREDDMRISVFTGPFLMDDDPVRFGVKVPVSFWKVIAFIHDETGQLCATGYTMSQAGFLSEQEFVFGEHSTAQTSIASIEQRAGIDFGPLAALDPFETVTEAPQRPLRDFSQIVFKKR